MPEIQTFFPTKIYRSEIAGDKTASLNSELAHSCAMMAEDDRAGRDWSKANGYKGYTSYSSLTDLPSRDPAFADLVKALDKHVRGFAKELEFDLGRKRPKLDSIWINVLAPGGIHTGHIHPLSIISGTYYVTVPKGAGALKFEDPRLAMMMAAPPRAANARPENRSFQYLDPTAGTVILWESWLRHEVPMNRAKTDRVSISFNYGW